MDAVTIGGSALQPIPGYRIRPGNPREFIGTFILMLVIMGVAVDQKAPPGFAGLVIGLTSGVHHHARKYFRGSLNTAGRSALIWGIFFWEARISGSIPDLYYRPILGAVAAAFTYDYLTT